MSICLVRRVSQADHYAHVLIIFVLTLSYLYKSPRRLRSHVYLAFENHFALLEDNHKDQRTEFLTSGESSGQPRFRTGLWEIHNV